MFKNRIPEQVPETEKKIVFIPCSRFLTLGS